MASNIATSLDGQEQPESGKQKITTFLTFNNQAEEAVNMYVSIFPDSTILNVNRIGGDIPGVQGTVISLTFQICGQTFMALNGGPHFKFSDGISLFISCQTQEEVDEYWEKLSDGGEKGPCGWLKDRFGVSWQVIPDALGKLIGDPDPEKSRRVVNAMLKMTKIDVAALEQAYHQG